MMKKIAILGGNGLLGSEMTSYFSKKNYEVLSLSRSFDGPGQVDITNFADLKTRLDKIKPDVVINCAALVDIPECEKNKTKCFESNVASVFNIIKALESKNTLLVHFSTDYVFESSDIPRTINDTVNPLNYYGKSKYLSEQIIRDLHSNYLIFRPTILFGIDHSRQRKDFISKVINSEEIFLDDTRIKFPLYTKDIARIVEEMISSNVKNELIHLAPSYCFTKFEMAKKIKKIFNLNCNINEKVEPSFPKRPDKIVLLEQKHSLNYTPFEECLKEIKEFYDENSSF
jgi:dTDP-4-dehydrorhamnose reductase